MYNSNLYSALFSERFGQANDNNMQIIKIIIYAN